MDQDDELDDYDRARASDMEERPIYPVAVLVGEDSSVEQQSKPEELEV